MKEKFIDILPENGTEIVVWKDQYGTGIELIDNQHMELVKLANRLYQACLGGKETVEIAFKEAMSQMVKYVRFHFGAEEKLLERVKYPQFSEHKKQHKILVQKILDAVKDYETGKNFVPNNFVRTLTEWVFGHIAIYDKIYAKYIADKKKNGSLTDFDTSIE